MWNRKNEKLIKSEAKMTMVVPITIIKHVLKRIVKVEIYIETLPEILHKVFFISSLDIVNNLLVISFCSFRNRDGLL